MGPNQTWHWIRKKAFKSHKCLPQICPKNCFNKFSNPLLINTRLLEIIWQYATVHKNTTKLNGIYYSRVIKNLGCNWWLDSWIFLFVFGKENLNVTYWTRIILRFIGSNPIRDCKITKSVVFNQFLSILSIF